MMSVNRTSGAGFLNVWTIAALAGMLAGSASVEAGGCPCDADIVPLFGSIDFDDVIAVTQCVSGDRTPAECAAIGADINCDGAVDHCDIGVAIAQFTGEPDSCSIPCDACCDSTVGACINATEFTCTISWSGQFNSGRTCADDNPCDCNNNGVEDWLDIQNLTSDDCDGNGVPDDCEPGACCFTADSGVCVGGPNDGRTCATDPECQGGTCTVSLLQS